MKHVKNKESQFQIIFKLKARFNVQFKVKESFKLLLSPPKNSYKFKWASLIIHLFTHVTLFHSILRFDSN